MDLTVYHLKNCDSCKKAIKALQAAGHKLELIDIRADGLDRKVIEKFSNSLGKDTILNTRSTTWRQLDDTDKQDVDDAKAIDLIVQNPTLLKRPAIESGAGLTVGWTKEIQEKYH